jgi:type I restriction enzyme M protein
VFAQWKTRTTEYAKNLGKGLHPKREIHLISESLLDQYAGRQLTDKYAMFQHLMDYYAETMQDDLYELAADGWQCGNELKRLEKKTKGSATENSKSVKYVPGIEGLEGRLIPPALIIQEYLGKEQRALANLEAEAETLVATMDELREEHGGEDSLLANAIENGKISKSNLQKAIIETYSSVETHGRASRIPSQKTRINQDNLEEHNLLQQYKSLMDAEAEVQAKIKTAKTDLETKVIAQYPKLTLAEIKTLVVEKKWMAAMEQRIGTEMDNISHRLTQRIKELADRYDTPMPSLLDEVTLMEEKVNAHLTKMGFVWK